MSVNDPNERVQQLERQLADTRASLDDARREAARYRTGNKGVLDETAQALAQLLGLDTESREGRPDVPTMAKRLATENRELKIRAALSEAMAKKGAKPSLTRAYLLDQGVLTKFDPSAADFHEQIETALEEALVAEPGLRSNSAPSRGGAELTGGTGQSPAYTREELSLMDPEQVVALRRSGRLGHLLGGR
jgi:hypothetical protein